MRQKEREKHCSLFFGLRQIQCFVLCFREEGPRAVTALYFGWPAFRNRHFVIWGGGGGWRGTPPLLYSSLGDAALIVNGMGTTSGQQCTVARCAWCSMRSPSQLSLILLYPTCSEFCRE